MEKQTLDQETMSIYTDNDKFAANLKEIPSLTTDISVIKESIKIRKHNIKRKTNPYDKPTKFKRKTTKSVLSGIHEPPVVKIPQTKCERAFNLLKSKSNFNKYKEIKCLKMIHEMDERKFEVTRDVNIKYLLQARKCLLRRDWNLLARILSVAHPITNLAATRFFKLYAKYATICLYHNQQHSDLLNSFLSGVLLANTTSKEFLAKLTKI